MAPPSKKRISGYIKIELPAGEAAPSQKVGTALGSRGINIMEFCKAFNERTKDIEKGMPTPIIITAFEDRSFSFITKTPPASFLIKRAAGVTSGSKECNKAKVGKVTRAQVREIAEIKMVDLSAASVEAAMRTVAGSARSMGIDVAG